MSKEKTELHVVKNNEEETKKQNKPTPEEVEQYKQEFTAALKEFDEKKWTISEVGNFSSNDIALYLLQFMDKFAFWSKTEWMGMIKMEEELNRAMKSANETTGLELGYQALEFCAYMMANPGGTGIRLAKEFESQADKYSKLGIVVGTKLEEARADLKNIQYLQEKWAAGAQGYYLADLEPKDESKKDADDQGGKVVEIDLSKKEKTE